MEFNVLDSLIADLGEPNYRALHPNTGTGKPKVTFRHFKMATKTDGDIVVLNIDKQPTRVFIRLTSAVSLDASPDYSAPVWGTGNGKPSPFFQHFELQREGGQKEVATLEVDGLDMRYFERMLNSEAIPHLAEDKGFTTQTKPGRGNYLSSK